MLYMQCPWNSLQQYLRQHRRLSLIFKPINKTLHIIIPFKQSPRQSTKNTASTKPKMKKYDSNSTTQPQNNSDNTFFGWKGKWESFKNIFTQKLNAEINVNAEFVKKNVYQFESQQQLDQSKKVKKQNRSQKTNNLNQERQEQNYHPQPNRSQNRQQLYLEQSPQSNLQQLAVNRRHNFPENNHQLKENKCCRICENYEDPQINFTKFGNCSHNFCQSCLHQYLKYEIQRGNFRQTGTIKCPQQNCRQYFRPQRCSFFMSLNPNLRSEYLRIVQACLKGSQTRCPSCKNGILKTQKQPIKCSSCHKSFEHKEVFSHLYRNCPKCGIPIQRISGCDHMKCDTIRIGCGYNFCYKCLRPSSKQFCQQPCSYFQSTQIKYYLPQLFDDSRLNCFKLRVLIIILFSPIILCLYILILMIIISVDNYSKLEQIIKDHCCYGVYQPLTIIISLLLFPLHFIACFIFSLIVCPILIAMTIKDMI